MEIRDIMIPKELQDALSKEAQAERERNARIILAEVEKDISEMFVEAAEVYDRNPRAMKLRAMNLAYEGAKDSKGVLLAPSALADGFNIGQAGREGEDLRMVVEGFPKGVFVNCPSIIGHCFML